MWKTWPMDDDAELPDWQPLTAGLARRSLAADDATGWFEPLYAAGRSGSVKMPWDRPAANPLLAAAVREMDADGRSVVVVGCGLGRDAEEVARHGFRTTAFDVSASAKEWSLAPYNRCRHRSVRRGRPGSREKQRPPDGCDDASTWA